MGFGVSVGYTRGTGKPAFRFLRKAQNRRQTGKPDFLIVNFRKSPVNRQTGFPVLAKISKSPANRQTEILPELDAYMSICSLFMAYAERSEAL